VTKGNIRLFAINRISIPYDFFKHVELEIRSPTPLEYVRTVFFSILLEVHDGPVFLRPSPSDKTFPWIVVY